VFANAAFLFHGFALRSQSRWMATMSQEKDSFCADPDFFCYGFSLDSSPVTVADS